MTTALITGFEGFTGRYMAEVLTAQGYDVIGLTRAGSGPGTLSADLCDQASVTQAVEAAQPDVVVHLAGIAFVAHGDVQAIYRTNVAGSRNLLAALAGLKKRPSSVLLASSANVYGNTEAELIDENVRPAPANDYAVSKIAMEFMAGLWASQLKITIARPFNYTGVGQSENFLLPKIVHHFKHRLPMLELGNLDVERDFSDVRVVVDCYSKLLDPRHAGKVVNVCSGVGHTLRDVLEMAARITGYSPQIRVNPAFVRDNEVKKLVGDKSLLERCIGPVRPIALEDTLAWMLAQPTGVRNMRQIQPRESASS